ncbi:hypothetical protein SPOG_05757 [Schizosaccharomyces cryophilus OY26]|uniref:Uncharacterized protein n=1 Tax=Schizosaccharomyces cryophilus (strain OY26 / ATCC MYA-4695 / CBS 11777 / NBRC 106824 / NRRL Y48691) TaxID=653667 RepID=S9XCF2_SCHCR|nr:uncharacterized protein SPOG_05757 [Schizosaccharomyces cryophilus OY26]EPY51526.1 hypothetical protein SPOG_05757 [Schizosaccharomyces cryophilus OY26]
MSEKELKFDSSDPPAYNHANVYNVDLEKGLPLYKPKDINKTSNSTSVKVKQSKKTIMTESSSFPESIKELHCKTSEIVNYGFPENVVLKHRNYRLLSTAIFSLLCTLAISYPFEPFSWLKNAFNEIKYDWTLLGFLVLLIVIWAIFYAFFYFFHPIAIGAIRALPYSIIFVCIAIGNIGVLLGGVIYKIGVLLGDIIYAVAQGFYIVFMRFLGLDYANTTETTGSPTLPGYQQRDDALAPPPTTTNEEIELQSNPTTQS